MVRGPMFPLHEFFDYYYKLVLGERPDSVPLGRIQLAKTTTHKYNIIQGVLTILNRKKF